MSPYLTNTYEKEYSPLAETRASFQALRKSSTLSKGLSSPDFQRHANNVSFSSSIDDVFFPCPFQQTEAVAIVKAVEGCYAACLADLRYGRQDRKINVTLERSARYLLGSYLFTIDGLTKADPNVKSKLKDTDLKKAQSIIYRRFSTGLYATKNPGEYFHLHGSLDASTALNMIGLPAFDPTNTEYRQCIDTIESRVRQLTAAELELLNATHAQAGVTAYKRPAFLSTPYGSAISSSPKWSVTPLESTSPPAPFPPSSNAHSLLAGIKVLELCRVIAGPSICRILTEYGASVLKITSPNLSDVPFFQIEGNMGKHAADLDLRSDAGRQTFEALLAEADVLVDGYRTGALDRLGYGSKYCEALARRRGKGFVYVSENCFGYGEHVDRPGWQQIADTVSGVAWAQGKFMGLDEPCVPPFPMSDYGTGLMGAVATLEALYYRARDGGSHHARCALVQWDNFLWELGVYPERVQQGLRERFHGPFFRLRHADHTGVFSGEALKTMKEVVPELFEGKEEWGETWRSAGYGAVQGKESVEVRCITPWSNVEGLEMGYSRATRPNGTDEATWEGWEVERPL